MADPTTDDQRAAVLALLPKIRRSGIAVNQGRSEQGITAVGRAVHLANQPVAAVSIALPASHYLSRRLPEYDAWLLGRSASRVPMARANTHARIDARGMPWSGSLDARHLRLNSLLRCEIDES